MFAGCRVPVGGGGACCGPTVGQSSGGGEISFGRAVGWSGVRAGALFLWQAARMFVLWRVVSNTNSAFCIFALLRRC